MTSVRCLAGIVCQPLLGGFADRHPEFPLKRIVSLSMLLSLGVSVWYWLALGMGGWGRCFWCGRSSAGWRCPPTLMDAMAIQFINDGVPYPPQPRAGDWAPGLRPDPVFPASRWALRGGEQSCCSPMWCWSRRRSPWWPLYPPYWGRPRARDGRAEARSVPGLLRSNPSFTLMLAGCC